MPTYSEMMKIFGYKSKNAVSKLVDKLIDAGFIEKDKTGKILPSSAWLGTPLLGAVKAGFPTDVEETYDVMNLEDFLVEKKDRSYMLEVDGDSMIEAHIEPGDMVVAERRSVAKDGEIVIAEVDGEWTMKYYREKNGKKWLEPANKKYKPIYPEQSLHIAAVVKAVVRKY